LALDAATKAIGEAKTAAELAAALAAEAAAKAFMEAAALEAGSAADLLTVTEGGVLNESTGSNNNTSNTIININVDGAIDPYGTARAIAETLNQEATTSGSFVSLGTSSVLTPA
jgi:membrane protein involved in colicin uptake